MTWVLGVSVYGPFNRFVLEALFGDRRNVGTGVDWSIQKTPNFVISPDKWCRVDSILYTCVESE